MPSSDTPTRLLQTPLHALHLELGARMVPFAGYAMPVQYASGLMAEHKHCRAAAALFDVSHMGQIKLSAANATDAAAALEALVPVDVVGLAPRPPALRVLHESGGRPARRPDGGAATAAARRERSAFGDVFLVVNAGGKAADLRHLQTHIGHRCNVTPLADRALLALQGPQAAAALARLNPAVTGMAFMDAAVLGLDGSICHVTRSGYTGEDGFEISVDGDRAVALARALLAQPDVKPAGLGARDTLRLEAGLCLYGHDIDDTTSPVEAGLTGRCRKCGAPAARAPAATRALRRSSGSWQAARSASASAWSGWNACRCAKARCCSTPTAASSAR